MALQLKKETEKIASTRLGDMLYSSDECYGIEDLLG